MMTCNSPFPEAAPSSRNPSRTLYRGRQKARAFSLVEVVLSIGVVAFAFIGVFSLLPAGMTAFREGMDASISAQIAQRVIGEAEQSNFDALVPVDGNNIDGVTVGGSSGQFYALPLRYFDDQGTELGVSDASTLVPTLTADERSRVVYTARVRGSLPGAADPNAQTSDCFTSLPVSMDGEGSNTARFNPRFTTFLTIQVTKNPDRLTLDSFIDTASFLISSTLARSKNLPVKTFTAIVTRNGYQAAN